MKLNFLIKVCVLIFVSCKTMTVLESNWGQGFYKLSNAKRQLSVDKEKSVGVYSYKGEDFKVSFHYFLFGKPLIFERVTNDGSSLFTSCRNKNYSLHQAIILQSNFLSWQSNIKNFSASKTYTLDKILQFSGQNISMKQKRGKVDFYSDKKKIMSFEGENFQIIERTSRKIILRFTFAFWLEQNARGKVIFVYSLF